jgi:catechol 2,3-dioxygenase-like lactoylglutathione lyase family enzyme
MSAVPGIRGRLRGALVALACLLSIAPAAAAEVAAVEAIGIPVADLECSRPFYSMLGFAPVGERELSGDAVERAYGVFGIRLRVARMQLGDEFVDLVQVLTPGGRPIPPDSRSNDRWFQHIAIIVRNMDRAYARLREMNVRYGSSAPQRLPDWNPAAGGIQAFYFRDPDGHFLEVLQFPPGKGEARWQRRDGPLFLGIDHTAIVVADTDASVGFYRDRLGMRVVGTSENHGPEQEHLNNVFGARLRITTLRAERGPGVELLHYLAPTDGRAMPADSRTGDLWDWHIRFRAVDPSVPARILRDPDGHASLVGTAP